MPDEKPLNPTATLDTERVKLGFGKGGVPWPLMVFYLSFLVFFVWYVLEYQLPDYVAENATQEVSTPAVEGE